MTTAVDPAVRLAVRHIESALDVMAGSIVVGGEVDDEERETWYGNRARIVEVVEEMVAAWAVRLDTDRAAADELPLRTPLPARPRVR